VYAIVGLSRTLVGSQSFDADPKCPLQLEQFGALFSGEQCGRHSAASGPPGSSDTVDEIFSHIRQIVVNDVDDVLDVNSAGSEIRRHEHTVASLLKTGKCCIALRLRAVAMNHRR
jgi:hypothetical protein